MTVNSAHSTTNNPVSLNSANSVNSMASPQSGLSELKYTFENFKNKTAGILAKR